MKRTPLRRVGKKQRRDRAELAELAPFGSCEAVFSLMCTGRGEVWHHITLRSRGGSNDRENLLRVCAPCHRAIHDNPTEATARGFMRSRYGGDAA